MTTSKEVTLADVAALVRDGIEEARTTKKIVQRALAELANHELRISRAEQAITNLTAHLPLPK